MAVPDYARRHLPAGVEEEMVGRRRQQLERVARSVTGVRTEARLLTGRPATALIQDVLRSGHDLLMRSHGRDLAVSGPKPFGAVDLELLRKCPCPVFLVRHGSPEPRPSILAAVNASTEDDAERSLNQRIVEVALAVSDLEGGEPLLLQAWTPFAEQTVRSHSPEDAYAAYVAGVRDRTEADLRRLAQSFGGRLTGARIVHRRGEPEEVIPAFVVAEGIDLVVMGTVARGGIAGLLFGNTAERVLRALPCSVLAVKPDGFVSPVSLEST
jgi:nucleotide-binding universal stress UspA family protein